MATEYVVATPSRSSITSVGPADRTVNPSTAYPSRPPHHSTVTESSAWEEPQVACEADDPTTKRVTWGCETTLRHATGMPAWTVLAARSRSARARAAATWWSPPGVGTGGGWSVRNAVLTSPVRKAGSRRTDTSWSRFVVIPWIRARARTPASARAA